MKTIIILSIILILIAFLLSSCRLTSKFYDYSQFPKGTILSGETKTGKTVYLVREEPTKMAGIFFIDNNQAVAETMTFVADSTGKTNFTFENDLFTGKIKVRKVLTEIELTLPEISSLKLARQTIRLSDIGRIDEKVDCPEVYKNPVFENIVAKKNIQYGTALGYYTSKPSDYISKEDYKKWFTEMLTTSIQHKGFLFKSGMEQLPLLLDVYMPDDEHIKKRPLLLFIHGGAFIFGDKESKIQQVFTNDFVKKGYVVASINYRLGTSITPDGIERTIYRDVQDARAALRYLVHHKKEFKIDEEQIYISGSSAGGIISLTTAFMDSNEVYSSVGSGFFRQRDDLGGLDDSGNDLKNSFKIAGVASLWGGVTNLDMLNNNIPTLLFHGTADKIVPNKEGLPFKDSMGDFLHGVLSYFGKIYGSEMVYNRLKSSNIPVKYIPFKDADHDPHLNSDNSLNENMAVISKEMDNFLYSNLSKHYFNYRLSGKTLVGKNDPIPVYKLDKQTNVTIQWHVEGGFITNQTNNSISVIWYSLVKKGVVTACITNENNVTFIKELEIKISADTE